MASINSSVGGATENTTPQKQYYTFRLYFNPPLEISLISRATATVGGNGKKFPQLSTLVGVGLVDRSSGSFQRTQITLSPDDWYRWMITVGELLSKVKSIYVDGHIADNVTEDDFKIVSFKGEVLQMVPLMAKIDDNLVPAVRVIVNEPSRFADFPLIDIKSMYNIMNRVEVMSASMLGAILGDSL